MDRPFYNVKILEDGFRFDYLSIGYSATHRAIIYQETEIPFLYSLVLAEVQRDNSLSVYAINSNADGRETMATVFRTIEIFTTNNPRAIIGFMGNTESKTRLYRMAITSDLDNFLERFMIWGVRSDNGKREPFRRDQPYNYFFVTNRFLN